MDKALRRVRKCYNLRLVRDSIHPLLKREYEKLFFQKNGVPDNTKPISLNAINPQEDVIDDDINGSNIKTRIIYITDLSNVIGPNGIVKGRGSEFGGCYTFLTDIGQSLETITHEFGHILNLLHCFDSTYPYVSDYQNGTFSNNFMDYKNDPDPNISDQRKQFYYYQWFHNPFLLNGVGTASHWIW